MPLGFFGGIGRWQNLECLPAVLNVVRRILGQRR
jgi:hypothetical protein